MGWAPDWLFHRGCSDQLMQQHQQQHRHTVRCCALPYLAKAPGLLPAVLARIVDREQEEEERRMLQRSWEMATILDFLELFRPYLSLSRGFMVHELESVLILSPGGEGLLGSLHIVSSPSWP